MLPWAESGKLGVSVYRRQEKLARQGRMRSGIQTEEVDVKMFARIQEDMIILTMRGGKDGRKEQTHLVLLGLCWRGELANKADLVLVGQNE